MIVSFLVCVLSLSFLSFLLLWWVFCCLLGLAGVSRQEEGQQRVSRGDDIFGNGKHQDALPVYCLWKASLFMNLFFCTYQMLFLNHILNFLYPLLSVFPSLVSWCPVSRYQPSKRHPVLPNCMPSRWKAGGIVCRRIMRLSTRGHWSTLKSLCGLSMGQILKRACKNKYASGFLSVGKSVTV